MRIEILNLRTVNTSWCSQRVVEWIKEEPEAIFFDLPRDFEFFFKSDFKLRKLKERVDVSFNQHLNALEPLVKFALDRDILIYCYKDSLHSISENSTSFKLLTLVLKARLGRVNPDEWRKAISVEIEEAKAYAEYEANYIAERAADRNVCLNLSEEIESMLKEFGFEIKGFQFYSFNRPIDRIYSLIKEERVARVKKDSELLDLIKKHVKFIDDVVEKGYEEACKLWEIA